MYCPKLHCIHWLDLSLLNCPALHCSALHWTTLLCSVAMNCNEYCVLKSTKLINSLPHCTALHCTAGHCPALHCTALHCTALHCTALHCTALHPCAPSLCVFVWQPHPPSTLLPWPGSPGGPDRAQHKGKVSTQVSKDLTQVLLQCLYLYMYIFIFIFIFYLFCMKDFRDWPIIDLNMSNFFPFNWYIWSVYLK